MFPFIFCDSVIFLAESEYVHIFIVCFLSNYKEGRDWNRLTGLSLSHFCTRFKPEPGFPLPYVVVFFVFSMICGQIYFVRFVDIGGIVDHHYLSSFCLYYMYIKDKHN